GVFITAQLHGRVAIEADVVGQRQVDIDTREYLVPGRGEVDAEDIVVSGDLVGTAIPVLTLEQLLVLRYVQPAAVHQFDQQRGSVPHRGVGKGGQAVDHRMHRLATRHAIAPVEAVNEARIACQKWVDVGRDAGQRHVLAVVEINAHTDTGDVLGQADAIHVDVVDIELVVATNHAGHQLGNTDRSDLQSQIRQHVRGVAVVQAKRAVQPFRAALGHQS